MLSFVKRDSFMPRLFANLIGKRLALLDNMRILSYTVFESKIGKYRFGSSDQHFIVDSRRRRIYVRYEIHVGRTGTQRRKGHAQAFR